MLEILGGKAKALILPGTDDKASHPRSKEVILKKTGILQKCFCAALAALLLLTFFGCSKRQLASLNTCKLPSKKSALYCTRYPVKIRLTIICQKSFSSAL